MSESGNSTEANGVLPVAAAAFAYGGAGLFFVLALFSWFAEDTSFEAGNLARTYIETMLGLAVVILSFLGGVRWGVAGAKGVPKFSDLTISIIPPAVAWLAMVLASDWMYSHAEFLNSIAPSLLENWRHAAQLFLMIVAFFILLVADRRAKAKGTLPDWYLAWRYPFTIGVEVALIMALVRTIQLQMGWAA